MNCGGRRFRRGPQDEGLCQKMCMVCMCGICGESAGGDGDGAMCTELLCRVLQRGVRQEHG